MEIQMIILDLTLNKDNKMDKEKEHSLICKALLIKYLIEEIKIQVHTIHQTKK